MLNLSWAVQNGQRGREKRIHPLITWLLISLLVLGACSIQQPVSSQEPEAYAQYLDRRVPELMRRYRVSGASLAMVRGGEIVWTAAYGAADQEAGEPMTVDTVFQAASISKSVAAWGVMRLVEEGKVELDAPVETYVGRWNIPASEFDPDGVTVRRLLSHTAGLSLHGYPGFPPDEPLPSTVESLSGETNGAGSVRLIHEPGSKFSYSGGGYTLLQLLIEEVTGESFADYMAREVLEPLGMERSSYVWEPELRDETATGYDWMGKRVPNYRFAARAAASLYTTAPDLGRFVSATAPGPDGTPAGGGVLSSETIEQMTRPAPATDGMYGLGYMVDELSNGTSVVQHSGGNRGWRTHFVALPEKEAGFVLLTNSDRGGQLIVDVVCSWIAWAGETDPAVVCQTEVAHRTIASIVAVVLAFGLLGYLVWVIVGVRAGSRQLVWPLTWRRGHRVAVIVVLLAVWWGLFYSQLAGRIVTGLSHYYGAMFLPISFRWITAVVTLWGVALIGVTFLPRSAPGEAAGND